MDTDPRSSVQSASIGGCSHNVINRLAVGQGSDPVVEADAVGLVGVELRASEDGVLGAGGSVGAEVIDGVVDVGVVRFEQRLQRRIGDAAEGQELKLDVVLDGVVLGQHQVGIPAGGGDNIAFEPEVFVRKIGEFGKVRQHRPRAPVFIDAGKIHAPVPPCGIGQLSNAGVGILLGDVGQVEGRRKRPGAAAGDEHRLRRIERGEGPVEHGADVGVAFVVDDHLVGVGAVGGGHRVGRRLVAEVDVGGAVGDEDGAMVGEGVFGVGLVEDAGVPGGVVGFGIDSRVVGGGHLQITDLAEPASAAALEVDQQLVGVAGFGEEGVRRAVRADRLAAGFDEVPAGSKRGGGIFRGRCLGLLAGGEGEEEDEGSSGHGSGRWGG